MAVIETWFEQDLNKAVKVHYLDGNVFSADVQGNKVGVNVYRNGSAETLTGTISGNVIRPDGTTVAISGSSSGNQAWVVLPQAAYAIPGVISIIIKNTVSSVVTTLCAVVANVYQSTTDTVVDPGTIIPSVQTLINSIDTAVASIPADYSSLWTSLAPAFSTSVSYAAGQYVTYNGGLYRFTTAHSGSWASGDVVAVNLGGELTDVKSALTLEKNLVDEQLGYDVPYFEIGTIAFGSSNIIYQNNSAGIRTPLGQETPVKAGDTIFLTNYEGYQYKYAVKKANNTYDYSAYRQTNAQIINDGLLYVVIATTNGDTQISTEPLGNLFRIKRKDTIDLQPELKALKTVVANDETHVTNVEERIETIMRESVGNDYAVMKRGQYSIGSSSITEQASTSRIITRTPIRVNPGDVFGLRDYTSAQYRYAVKRDSDNKNDYTSTAIVDDTIVKNAGLLYIEVSKQSGDITDSEIDQYAALVKLQRYSNSQMPDYANRIKDIRQYANILENSQFDYVDFVRGESTGTNPYIYAPGRQYRATLRTPIYAINDYNIIATTGYRFAIIKSTDRGATWTSTSWVTSGTVERGALFSLNLALSSDSASTPAADVPTYVSKYTVTTPIRTAIEEGISDDLSDDDLNAIETHMSHFYNSDVADSYVFFTDPHLMGTNGTFDERTFKYYMDKVKAVVDRITANYIVCGGDWLTSGDTKDEASMKLGFVDGQMEKYFGKRYLPIVGNHDFNYLGVDGNGNRLDPADWVPNAAMRNFWFNDFEHCYYSVKSVFTRFYILNTRTDYDGVTDYDKTMLDWLAAQLIQDDPEHATIMLHIYYLNYSQQTLPNRVSCVGKIIAAFNGHTTCTLTAATDGYEKTYDFTGKTGHIDYSIAGHSHADFSATFGGVPIVGVDNFQGDGEPTFDMVFADYTAGKLYCTRIGTGSDRTFDI